MVPVTVVIILLKQARQRAVNRKHSYENFELIVFRHIKPGAIGQASSRKIDSDNCYQG